MGGNFGPAEKSEHAKMMGLARHRKLLALCVALVSIAWALPAAIWRPLDFSELIEFYIEQLPSLPQILHILMTHPPTTDPPLGYAIVHASRLLFGPSALSERLPSMVGVAVGVAGFFLFLSRRIAVEAALLAPTLVCASSSMFSAYERRYGILLGASALLLLAWQSVDPLRNNRLALAGVTLSLGFALLIHYYAVLLCLPILSGELIRAWRKRKIFFPPVIAVALAFVSCAAWIPFWKASMAFKAHIWFVADLDTALQSYGELINPAWVIFALVLTMLPVLFLNGQQANEEREPRVLTGWLGIPAEELAALLVLALLPVLGYGLAKFTTRLFQTRYVLPSTFGCCGL
jgi:hypothetical protein